MSMSTQPLLKDRAFQRMGALWQIYFSSSSPNTHRPQGHRPQRPLYPRCNYSFWWTRVKKTQKIQCLRGFFSRRNVLPKSPCAWHHLLAGKINYLPIWSAILSSLLCQLGVDLPLPPVSVCVLCLSMEAGDLRVIPNLLKYPQNKR